MSRIIVPLLAALCALALAAPAMAANYPPPGNPGAPQTRPAGPHRTLLVCEKKSGHGCFPRIQDAVNAAHAGDTVRVPHGTWHEAVTISGSGKRYLRLVGDVAHPEKVVLDGDNRHQNGVLVNAADHVSVRGFSAHDYRANGFFATNLTGYVLSNLIARHTGTYGIYAFNTKGGLMADSVASENNDGGYYIGQTPPQSKPIRSMVRNVVAHTNVIGFSGTNMRYVTITKSRFFNNAVGIVPNALDSEKYAPPEDNVIVDNDVFWNNFDYFRGAPFKLRKSALGSFEYPPGVGIVIYGGRRNHVTGNRIFGNYLAGAAMIQAVTLKQDDSRDLIGNEITGNAFGKDGTDLNGLADIAYNGNGSDNCIAGNTGVQTTLPTDQSTFAACPFSGKNTENGDALNTMAAALGDPTHEAYWVNHAHAPISGITPLEHWTR